MKKVLLLIMSILVFVLSSCSSPESLKTGRYTCAGEPSILLESDNKFILNGPHVISAALMGSYTVKEDKLILTANENEEYIFSIDNGTLVFESGAWFEEWVEKGTRFHLSED